MACLSNCKAQILTEEKTLKPHVLFKGPQGETAIFFRLTADIKHLNNGAVSFQ